MEIINRKQRIASLTRKLRRENKTIGFVPTMGALHEGHLSLVKEARQMCDVVIVSIFVNPTQFNDKTDLDKYPRDLAGDASMLAEYQVDYVFAPDKNEIYGENFSTYVYVENLTETLEGASRPGHFRGVATVVTILFNTIRPDFAFFGQKDAQQVAVIKRLTKDLGFDTEIVVQPTVREESGLAMSSRNLLLSEEERAKASIIFKGLREAKIAFRNGERNASNLAEIVRQMVESEPLALVDYIAVVNNETLESVDKIEENEVLIAVAVNFGKIRLIDNIVLNKRQ
ncbi:MAG TPA: pantoate--beta-alanine ligase [Pyrinomonadaceae bacterium]|nr:pantoate--beta-alanine ligase [Pyrinomonadaceae bacterium]